MNRMFAFTAALAAGIALAPMAADAAKAPIITFYQSVHIDPWYSGTNVGLRRSWGETPTGGALAGSFLVDTTIGQATPINAGERTIFDIGGRAIFGTGDILSARSEFDESLYWYVDEYEWKGGGSLTIYKYIPYKPDEDDTGSITLLTATFAEPVTGSLGSPVDRYIGSFHASGILQDVVIHEDLAAYYGVPSRGSGEIGISAQGRYGPVEGGGFSFQEAYGSVTFHPVPVPAALPLMLTALAGLGLIGWRRRQNAA